MIAGLVFREPLWWLAALVPIAYLLFAHALHKAPIERFGSLALWREARDELGETAAKRALDGRTLLRFVALGLVVAAMAGPEWATAKAQRTWTFVLGSGLAAELAVADGGESRGAAVLAAARAFAERYPDDRFAWAPVGPYVARRASAQAGEVVLVGGAAGAPSPEVLSAAPERDDWGAWDRAGCVWLPVAPLETEPRAAALVQVAWAAAPGAVAVRGDARLWWDGAATRTVPGARPWLWARGPAWAADALLGRVADAVAATNGWRVVRAGEALPEGEPLVVLMGTAGGTDDLAARRHELAGAGWTVAARLGGVGGGPAGLRPVEGVRLVAAPGLAVGWRPGLLWTDVTWVEEPSAGLPPGFIVAWSAAIERAARAPSVPLAARRAAVARQGAARAPAAPVDPRPLGAELAALAVVLLLGTLKR